jgi:DNA (cytosine-5)-methyltransferase 1
MLRTMHLFAGAGGGLLADLILGHTPVVAVEWVPYACQVLRERAADGWFPDLYVYEGDVRLFDPSDYAGRVDCIHAGFPCQDLSVAGNQAGLGEGTRSGLYREVLRIAGVVRPKYLFMENVAAILSGGLGTVLGDLAARGYDCRWCCLEASGVGAPHRRDRWWLLATMADTERTTGEQRSEPDMQRRRTDEAEQAGMGGCDVADASCSGLPFSREKQEGKNGWKSRGMPSTASWWQAEPDLGRVVDGVASRVDRLKALGNGQVPLQAAVAWKILGG